MISTDRFVFVHEPKTGGTFISTVLFRLHGAKWNASVKLRLLLFRQVTQQTRFGPFTRYWKKHATSSEIPQAQRHKPILASIRNPYDHYVSLYEFGWWKRRDMRRWFRHLPDFEQRYPQFPDLSFADYVHLANEAFGPERPGASRPDTIGLLTRQFIQYYCREPQRVFAGLRDEDTAVSQCRSALFDVCFLRTDWLNAELHAYLQRQGYPPEDLTFILELDRIIPDGGSRDRSRSWESYYTPELKAWVRERERVLFALFPDFDRDTVVGARTPNSARSLALGG